MQSQLGNTMMEMPGTPRSSSGAFPLNFPMATSGEPVSSATVLVKNRFPAFTRDFSTISRRSSGLDHIFTEQVMKSAISRVRDDFSLKESTCWRNCPFHLVFNLSIQPLSSRKRTGQISGHLLDYIFPTG